MTTNETNEESDDTSLTACAAPGRHWFLLSGTLQTLETLFTMTRWGAGALAWTAQAVMDGRAGAHAAWGLAAFAVASVGAVGARWMAGKIDSGSPTTTTLASVCLSSRGTIAVPVVA
jgi:ATP-binding cassette subfamily C protein CydD